MTDQVRLGQTDIEVSALGVGTWQWGDRRYWGYGREYGEADIEAAFRASTDAGVNFFDTAEIYGQGESERLLGQFVRESGAAAVITTKFLPFPWRFRGGSLLDALHRSLRRLQLETVDLYLVHWPMPPRSPEAWAEALADAVEAGLTRAVGVSNYNADKVRRAHEALARRGVALAANQVAFSLLRRKWELEGLLDVCRELGVTLIAYSPLAQGLLTGKYSRINRPPRIRRVNVRFFRRGSGIATPDQIERLLGVMGEVGEAHDGRTQAQVALNWVICKGAIPIPGAKNAEQARSNAGALGWRLTDDEVALLDEESARV